MAKKTANREQRREEKAGAAQRRRIPLWAIGVLVLQLGLMLSVFNPVAHNGGDTAGYVTLAHSLLDRGTYQDLWEPGQPPHTKYPPFFPILLAIAISLGARTWAALKVVPALFTTLSVMAVYQWARDRRGAPFAAAVALLTAVSNAVLWASHWELSDPPFVAFTFVALWAFERVTTPRVDGAAAAESDSLTPRLSDTVWLIVAGVATGLAYSTRQAGLPLLVAAAGWLLVNRRVRAAVALGAGIGVPAILWSLRGNQGAQYVSEFWMIDPYQPDLGRVGIGGLIQRVIDNAVGYVGQWVPIGYTGMKPGAAVAIIGVVVFALGIWGWVRHLRRPSVTELFVPMYLGLILLWPQVWSGDRFALPIMPLVLFYAGEMVVGFGQWGGVVVKRIVVTAAIGVLALPALVSWGDSAAASKACSSLVDTAGSFSCWGPRTDEFVQAAAWSGAHLPDGAITLSRKPRIWYVMSGLSSETFPFTRDAPRFLAFADSIGAHYVVMDYMDSAASVYVAQALQDLGGSFCLLQTFGGDARNPPTLLMGILPVDERLNAVTSEEGNKLDVSMNYCPARMARTPPLAERSGRTQEIPLLMGFK